MMRTVVVCAGAVICLFTWGCQPGAQQISSLASGGFGAGKVTICHLPGGDPQKAIAITVSANALPAHLGGEGPGQPGHGDFECANAANFPDRRVLQEADCDCSGGGTCLPAGSACDPSSPNGCCEGTCENDPNTGAYVCPGAPSCIADGQPCDPNDPDACCGVCNWESDDGVPVCATCTPNCIGKTCGSDGCGGSCGTCSTGDVCIGGNCCTKDCTGRVCGLDPVCGQSCGTCGEYGSCTDVGTCEVSCEALCSALDACIFSTPWGDPPEQYWEKCIAACQDPYDPDIACILAGIAGANEPCTAAEACQGDAT